MPELTTQTDTLNDISRRIVRIEYKIVLKESALASYAAEKFSQALCFPNCIEYKTVDCRKVS